MSNFPPKVFKLFYKWFFIYIYSLYGIYYKDLKIYFEFFQFSKENRLINILNKATFVKIKKKLLKSTFIFKKLFKYLKRTPSETDMER